MSEQQVLYAQHQGLCCFKLSGELRHTVTDGLDELIGQLFERRSPPCTQVVIDLTEARFMDSTCIGLLTSVARHAIKHDLGAPTLFVTDPELRQMLLSLRLETVFTLVDQPLDDAMAFEPVPSHATAPSEHASVVLRAHEALVALNEANREAFQPVIDCLRAEIDKR